MKYFEGFYVRCTTESDSLAVIFGRQKSGKDASSFIQIITKDASFGVTYGTNVQCIFKEKKFEVRVGDSFADKSGLSLDIDAENFSVKGRVNFGEFTKIKYGCMGPLSALPLMECKHYVVSMKHTLQGQIVLNGKEYDFDDGIGYIEGDKGKSFPQKYFWSQCSDKGISLFASAARIPYLGIRFMGTICVAHFEDKEYRFATYLGAKVKQIDEKNLRIRQGKRELTVEVLDEKKGLPLAAPSLGKMTRVIKESLMRTVCYRLTNGEKVLFDFTSNLAAHEFSQVLD